MNCSMEPRLRRSTTTRRRETAQGARTASLARRFLSTLRLESALQRVTIYDPVTMMITQCFPEMKTCRQVLLDPSAAPEDQPAGPSSDGKSVLTRESLGTKTIDGLACTGTRETRTFNRRRLRQRQARRGHQGDLVFAAIAVQSLRHAHRSAQRHAKARSHRPQVGRPRQGVVRHARWLSHGDGPRHPELAPCTLLNLSRSSKRSSPACRPTSSPTALQPVEAAIGAYAKAHAQASPNDKSDAFAGQLRMRLSSDCACCSMNQTPPKAQLEEVDLRMNETFRAVASFALHRQAAARRSAQHSFQRRRSPRRTDRVACAARCLGRLPHQALPQQ